MAEPVQIPGMVKGWRIVAAWHSFVDDGFERAGYYAEIHSPPWAWNNGGGSRGYGKSLVAAIRRALDTSSARKLPTPDQIEQLAATLEQGTHDDT